MLCDLYVRWTRLCPNKTDSPLIINPYAVVSRSIPGQRLKSVSRRRLQVLECRSRIKHPEFSRRKLTNRSKLLGPVRFKEFLCIGALESLNCHASNCIPFTGMQQGSGLAAKNQLVNTGIMVQALDFAGISAIADMDGVVLLAPIRPPVCHRSVSWRTRERRVCARSPGARECKTLHSVSSRREDADRNRRHPDGIGAIKLEAAPRYQFVQDLPSSRVSLTTRAG